ncbi:MAG TPA: Uma2 family endonuclease [Spirochaetes bacterium]|nr:Uma2 family endonuclease [Spirochaetota bacterium]
MDWNDLCEMKELRDIPFKVELNELGKIEMSPTKWIHGSRQSDIAYELSIRTSKEQVFTELAVQMGDSVRVTDVACVSQDQLKRFPDEDDDLTEAPMISVEIKSKFNTMKEMEYKRKLYLTHGAEEFWLVMEDGQIRFFNLKEELESSRIFPDFPKEV